MKLNVEIQLDYERINDLLVTALEGGSNYWYFIPDSAAEIVKEVMQRKKMCFSDAFFQAIVEGDYLDIHDVENEDERLGIISMESIVKAFMLLSINHPNYIAEILSENEDAETADVFFQYAVMGKIVFG